MSSNSDNSHHEVYESILVGDGDIDFSAQEDDVVEPEESLASVSPMMKEIGRFLDLSSDTILSLNSTIDKVVTAERVLRVSGTMDALKDNNNSLSSGDLGLLGAKIIKPLVDKSPTLSLILEKAINGLTSDKEKARMKASDLFPDDASTYSHVRKPEMEDLFASSSSDNLHSEPGHNVWD